MAKKIMLAILFLFIILVPGAIYAQEFPVINSVEIKGL